MSIPGCNTMIQPLLKYLVEANEVVELTAIRKEMARIFNVTAEEQQEWFGNGRKRFFNRVGWAVYFLRSAGLLRSPQRNCFEVTQEGRDEFDKGTELSRKYLMQRYEYIKQQLAEECRQPSKLSFWHINLNRHHRSTGERLRLPSGYSLLVL